MTEQELYEKITSKYPQYSKISKEELLPKIYEKYPTYKNSVTIDSSEQPNQKEDSVISPIEKLQSILVGNAPLKERALAGAIGGIPPAITGAKKVEDTLPLVMGSLGGVAGSAIGKPNVGVGVGTGTGELLKQTAKKLMGRGDDIDFNDVLLVGGSAAAGSKALEVAFKSAGIATKLIPEQARAKFYDKALQAVEVGGKKLGSAWRSAVNKIVTENPNVRVDLSGVMHRLSNMKEAIGENIVPQLKTAVSRSPKLLEAVDNPSLAKELTLLEAQELKNAITSTTNAITRQAVKGKTTPNERLVFEVLDNIDDAITSKFPQMSDVRKAYSDGKKAFEMARPLVEPGKAVESSIMSQPKGLFGAGGTPLFGSTQGRLAVKKTMEMTDAGSKMFEAAKLAHNVNRAADFIGRIGQIGVGGAIVNKLFKRKPSEFPNR